MRIGHVEPAGFQNSATGAELGFYAALYRFKTDIDTVTCGLAG